MGSETIQESLWGTQPKDWCEIQEPMMLSLYDTIFNELNIEDKTILLDAGCGAGFCFVNWLMSMVQRSQALMLQAIY